MDDTQFRRWAARRDLLAQRYGGLFALTVGIIVLFALSRWQDTYYTISEHDGRVYIVWSTWWGLSKDICTVQWRDTGDGYASWHYDDNGRWVPLDFYSHEWYD